MNLSFSLLWETSLRLADTCKCKEKTWDNNKEIENNKVWNNKDSEIASIAKTLIATSNNKSWELKVIIIILKTISIILFACHKYREEINKKKN